MPTMYLSCSRYSVGYQSRNSAAFAAKRLRSQYGGGSIGVGSTNTAWLIESRASFCARDGDLHAARVAERLPV